MLELTVPTETASGHLTITQACGAITKLRADQRTSADAPQNKGLPTDACLNF